MTRLTLGYDPNKKFDPRKDGLRTVQAPTPDSGYKEDLQENDKFMFDDPTGKLSNAVKNKDGTYTLNFADNDKYFYTAKFAVGKNGQAEQISDFEVKDTGSGMVDALALTAASFALPGIGQTIGSSLGLSGTTASVVGGGLTQGLLTELSGGDFLKGAVSGALGGASGALGSGISSTLDISTSAGKILANAGIAGARAEMNGGDFFRGAILASLPGVSTGNRFVDNVVNSTIRTGVNNVLG